jgi:hypothetical protein
LRLLCSFSERTTVIFQPRHLRVVVPPWWFPRPSVVSTSTSLPDFHMPTSITRLAHAYKHYQTCACLHALTHIALHGSSHPGMPLRETSADGADVVDDAFLKQWQTLLETEVSSSLMTTVNQVDPLEIPDGTEPGTVHPVTLRSVTLHCTALCSVTLHCTALCSVTLHSGTLHCTACSCYVVSCCAQARYVVSCCALSRKNSSTPPP